MRPGRALLLMGLLLSAHSELRARDPEVERENEGPGATEPRGSAEAAPQHSVSQGRVPQGRVPQGSVPQGSVPQGSVPTRSGNWCAFVQKREVTAAVMTGTEQYPAKFHSPCPSGAPNCQLVMYKLSTRPVFTETQRVVTALLWQCCPGHTGHNCDDSVSSARLDPTYSGHSEDPSPQLGSEEQPEHMDPHQEQNDHQGRPYHTSSPHRSHNTPLDTYGSDHTHRPDPAHQPHRPNQLDPAQQPHHTHRQQHTHQPDPAHHADNTYRARAQHTLDPNLHLPRDRVDPMALRYQDTPAVLPVPHMMALVMSQLQPVLEAFNRSLVHMQSQLGALAFDVAELKGQSSPVRQASSLSRTGQEEDEDKLEQVYQELRETQDQLQYQRQLLDSHHASLLSNLTSLRTDMDIRFRQQENMLQVKVQAMNLSLAELKLDQKQPSPVLTQDSETSALWTAIERLDNTVVNNTVKVQALEEDVEVISGSVQQLYRLHSDQDKRINATSRRSQVQFMETGLEVEAAKVVVLRRVEELAGNLSLQGQRLSELDVDVDYLYTVHYKNNSSDDCSCSELRTAITRLQRDLANVTELANEIRLALEESEGQGEPWGDSDWQPAVEALQQEIQQIKSSWALEENRTRAVEHSLVGLSLSLEQCQAEVSLLQQTEAKQAWESKLLNDSFKSLLKDAIRHSDVLEILLGEEVLEFLDWPIHDKEEHSIPALKELLRHQEEQLRVHNQSIVQLMKHRTGPEEFPAADQPSPHPHPLTEWLSGDSSSSSGRGPSWERQGLHRPQLRDGSDLWKLEQAVKELQHRVENLEENQNSNRERDPQLWNEVMWLKRGLEDHLKVFKNIFSNTDRLAASKQTLELDKVFDPVKCRQRKRGGAGGAH